MILASRPPTVELAHSWKQHLIDASTQTACVDGAVQPDPDFLGSLFSSSIDHLFDVEVDVDRF